MRTVSTIDTKALNHILMNTSYERPESGRYNLSRVLGDGVLVVEGEKHRQQVCSLKKYLNNKFESVINHREGSWYVLTLTIHDR